MDWPVLRKIVIIPSNCLLFEKKNQIHTVRQFQKIDLGEAKLRSAKDGRDSNWCKIERLYGDGVQKFAYLALLVAPHTSDIVPSKNSDISGNIFFAMKF